MFKVYASHRERIEIRSNMDSVREFFSDTENYVRFMPNVRSIHTDGEGQIHWKIAASVPFVGDLAKSFMVYRAEESEDRIEWAPFADEDRNFLKCSADFQPKSAKVTLVQFSKAVELRRRSASELHMLAGLAGSSLIGSEMSKGIAEMLGVFANKARTTLE